jgi:hypothetical protein
MFDQPRGRNASRSLFRHPTTALSRSLARNCAKKSQNRADIPGRVFPGKRSSRKGRRPHARHAEGASLDRNLARLRPRPPARSRPVFSAPASLSFYITPGDLEQVLSGRFSLRDYRRSLWTSPRPNCDRVTGSQGDRLDDQRRTPADSPRAGPSRLVEADLQEPRSDPGSAQQANAHAKCLSENRPGAAEGVIPDFFFLTSPVAAISIIKDTKSLMG